MSNIESSMKSWVNKQLTGYYTIAEVDAKLTILNDACATKESLQNEISNMANSLKQTKSEIKTAYTKAIEDAINNNNGVIDGKIAEAVQKVNTNLTSKISTI